MVLLARDDGSVELRVNGVFVMDSDHTTTERELARVGLGQSPSPAAVLVGGLGLGFTAATCLEDRRVERLTVVEIEQPVVDWVACGLVPQNPHLSADPRLEIVVADLVDHVRGTDATYDVALLDIDNGPGYLVHEANERAYTDAFLRRLRSRLNPQGVAVIWSATPSLALQRSMAEVFTGAEGLARTVDLQGRDERYFLYIGRA